MAKYAKFAVVTFLAFTALLCWPRLVGAATKNPTNSELVMALAREFGPEMPHFYQIVDCESDFLQWKPNGDVVVSSTTDIGITQINLNTWGAKANELGLDIFNSWQDNVKMAGYVYRKQGFSAWVCHNKVIRQHQAEPMLSSFQNIAQARALRMSPRQFLASQARAQ